MEIWKLHALGGSDIFKLGLYQNRPTGKEEKMAPEGKFVSINEKSCRRLYIRNIRKIPAQPVDKKKITQAEKFPLPLPPSPTPISSLTGPAWIK